jgi:hypothetical protein
MMMAAMAPPANGGADDKRWIKIETSRCTHVKTMKGNMWLLPLECNMSKIKWTTSKRKGKHSHSRASGEKSVTCAIVVRRDVARWGSCVAGRGWSGGSVSRSFDWEKSWNGYTFKGAGLQLRRRGEQGERGVPEGVGAEEPGMDVESGGEGGTVVVLEGGEDGGEGVVVEEEEGGKGVAVEGVAVEGVAVEGMEWVEVEGGVGLSWQWESRPESFATHSSVAWQHTDFSHLLVKIVFLVQQHVQPVWPVWHSFACFASHSTEAELRGAIGDAAAAAIARAKRSKMAVFDMWRCKSCELEVCRRQV